MTTTLTQTEAAPKAGSPADPGAAVEPAVSAEEHTGGQCGEHDAGTRQSAAGCLSRGFSPVEVRSHPGVPCAVGAGAHVLGQSFHTSLPAAAA